MTNIQLPSKRFVALLLSSYLSSFRSTFMLVRLLFRTPSFSSCTLAPAAFSPTCRSGIRFPITINDRFVIPSRRAYTMSTDSKHTAITHDCLSDLYNYWFEHAPDSRESGDPTLPTESLKIWFQGGEAVDTYCENNFKGAVEHAINTPIQDLINLGTKDPKGKDALALILLLDQMPRNIYRGKDAKIAYEQCDPKAQELAKIFTSEPYNFDSRVKCPTWWHQSFLYMPCELSLPC